MDKMEAWKGRTSWQIITVIHVFGDNFQKKKNKKTQFHTNVISAYIKDFN